MTDHLENVARPLRRRSLLGLLGAAPLAAGALPAASAMASTGTGGAGSGRAHGGPPPADLLPGGAYDQYLTAMAAKDQFSGTVLFYHFLATLDYQGRGLVLRRKSEAGSRTFQAAARRDGYRPLPLWLADTHFPCTLGSLNNFGPHVVSMDTGGPGIGITCSEQVAQEAGIQVDYQDPTRFQGIPLPSISPDKISLGDAVGRHVPGVVTANQPGSSGPYAFGFQSIGNFTHEFFKPFAVTFDYLRMNLYVTPTVPDYRPSAPSGATVR